MILPLNVVHHHARVGANVLLLGAFTEQFHRGVMLNATISAGLSVAVSFMFVSHSSLSSHSGFIHSISKGHLNLNSQP